MPSVHLFFLSLTLICPVLSVQDAFVRVPARSFVEFCPYRSLIMWQVDGEHFEDIRSDVDPGKSDMLVVRDT